MITRGQIEEIQSESREKGVSIKKLLEEKGIPAHQYFWCKRKYCKPEVAEGFLPVSGAMPSAAMSGMSSCGVPHGKSKADPTGENWMSIELRTVTGTDMRIQGGLTPAMVYTTPRPRTPWLSCSRYRKSSA